MPLGTGGLCAWSGPGAALTGVGPAVLAASGGRSADWWAVVIGLLAGVVPPGCEIVLGYRLLRLGRRIDAVVVTDRAILVLLIVGEGRAGDRAAVEEMALDLADFHAGCRGVPVMPVLVLAGGRADGARPLPFPGATPVVETTRALFPGLLHEIALRFPRIDLSSEHRPDRWIHAAYRPVPALIEAACLLYRRHDVTALRLAGAGDAAVARTGAAIHAAIRDARAAGDRLIIFVTGPPGAGKTLCGLDIAFSSGETGRGGIAFLTGNPTLVHVIREALARDAAQHGMQPRAARQRMQGVIQPLPAFRDHYLTTGVPPESIVVIDEAQRCWTALHAVSKTQNRSLHLTDSEPGHLLDIMGRRAGGAIIVCLIGSGQEIHAGEGGMAVWGAALQTRPAWRAMAPPDGPPDGQMRADPRQTLPPLPHLRRDPALALGTPMRAIHTAGAAAWVDAVLRNDPDAARALAATFGTAPFRITRCLAQLRRALRPRGARRAGLVASSGARRLRAEGLGSVLAHQDDDAVARWFLDRWPDIRSAEALETVATEFSVQGLELRY